MYRSVFLGVGDSWLNLTVHKLIKRSSPILAWKTWQRLEKQQCTMKGIVMLSVLLKYLLKVYSSENTHWRKVNIHSQFSCRKCQGIWIQNVELDAFSKTHRNCSIKASLVKQSKVTPLLIIGVLPVCTRFKHWKDHWGLCWKQFLDQKVLLGIMSKIFKMKRTLFIPWISKLSCKCMERPSMVLYCRA